MTNLLGDEAGDPRDELQALREEQMRRRKERVGGHLEGQDKEPEAAKESSSDKEGSKKRKEKEEKEEKEEKGKKSVEGREAEKFKPGPGKDRSGSRPKHSREDQKKSFEDSSKEKIQALRIEQQLRQQGDGGGECWRFDPLRIQRSPYDHKQEVAGSSSSSCGRGSGGDLDHDGRRYVGPISGSSTRALHQVLPPATYGQDVPGDAARSPHHFQNAGRPFDGADGSDFRPGGSTLKELGDGSQWEPLRWLRSWKSWARSRLPCPRPSNFKKQRGGPERQGKQKSDASRLYGARTSNYGKQEEWPRGGKKGNGHGKGKNQKGDGKKRWRWRENERGLRRVCENDLERWRIEEEEVRAPAPRLPQMRSTEPGVWGEEPIHEWQRSKPRASGNLVNDQVPTVEAEEPGNSGKLQDEPTTKALHEFHCLLSLYSRSFSPRGAAFQKWG